MNHLERRAYVRKATNHIARQEKHLVDMRFRYDIFVKQTDEKSVKEAEKLLLRIVKKEEALNEIKHQFNTLSKPTMKPVTVNKEK
jgi:hypothetical protein